jgi:hypothetical protein
MPLTDNPAALLAQILDHPRVKAYCEARGWWTNDECEQCSGYGDIHGHNGVGQEFQRECDECDGRGLIPRYTGPDLSLESNLHELLGLADAISDFDVDVMADCEQGPEHFSVTIYSNANEETGESDIHRGYGPTRTLAVLAALGRALNINEGNE